VLGKWHALGMGEVPAGFWWGNLRERGRLKELGVDGRINGQCLSQTPVGGGDVEEI
jgi:hypothetical protein